MRHRTTFQTIGIESHRYSVGLGYVIIPHDVDRSLFVARALRTCKIWITTENNEVLGGIRVSKQVAQQIEFPETSDDLGSAVLTVTVPNKNKPVIVAVLLKEEEVSVLNENQFLIDKITENGLVQISGNADTGEINIVASHETSSKLNLISRGEGAEINIKSDGPIQVESESTISVRAEDTITIRVVNSETNEEGVISYTNGEGFSYIDEFGNEVSIAPGGMVIKSDKVSLGSVGAAEASVLGTSAQIQLALTQVFLETLKTVFSTWVPVPSDGGASLKVAINAAISSMSVGDYSNILSTKVFVE